MFRTSKWSQRTSIAPVSSFSLVLPSNRSANFPANQNHTFGWHATSLADPIGVRLGGTDDDLGQSVAIAEIDKDSTAVVAFAFDPTAQGDFSSNVRFAELSAGMGA